MRINEIAAIIHRDMVDDDRNGYSWEERYGEPGNYKELEIGGRTYRYQLGDRDCSSSASEAWQLALWHTPFAGLLDGATYTGNIASVFLASGLFERWDTYSTDAETGDLYLNEGCHVAMCQNGGQDGGWDCLSEFSWGDNGAYGNVRGDQSGWEGHVQGYYSYPWDMTLHYNGGADDSFIDGSTPDEGEDDPTPPTKRKRAKYRAMADDEWCPLMVDLHDMGGSDDTWAGVIGTPIQYFACNYHKYRVMTKESLEEYEAGRSKTKWLDWVYKYDLDDLVHGAAGDGSPILYLQVMSSQVAFEVHCTDGKWRKAKKTKCGLRAGDVKHAIDAVRMWKP